MPKVSQKRQITLPVDQCKLAGIEPGDEYTSFVDQEGHITLFKKKLGAAKSILKGTKVDPKYSDKDSMQSSISQ